MEYQKLIEEVEKFDFIPDEQIADSAIKATLGIMVSRLTEADARQFTSKLPKPLTYEKLRSHQKRPIGNTFTEYITEIANQFKFSKEQSYVLFVAVLSMIKETVGEIEFSKIESHLPSDWAKALEYAR